MWFAYMDEAGNTGRNLADRSQPIHLILTVAMDEAYVRPVHERMRDIARRHCPGICENADFEFHGHALFAGSGPFDGMTPDQRIAIYDDVLATIGLAGTPRRSIASSTPSTSSGPRRTRRSSSPIAPRTSQRASERSTAVP
jgi:hypothetical protein